MSIKIINNMNDKLLKEIINLLVERNDNFDHNINKIFNDVDIFYSMQYILPDIDNGPAELKKLLAQITPLHRNKIVNVAGEGTTAVALTLDNDHILKIMRDHRQAATIFARYKSFVDNVYSGKGSLKDIFIYSLGEASTNSCKVYWIDMMKLKTLTQWVATQDEDYSWLINGIKHISNRLLSFNGTPIEIIKLFHETLMHYSKGSNEDVIMSIIETYVNMLKTFHNHGPDFHVGNIGVIEHDDRAPVFVMFDF